MRSRWACVFVVPGLWIAACSSTQGTGFGDSGDNGTAAGDDSGAGNGFGGDNNQGYIGVFTGDGGAPPVSAGPCKGGHYEGTFDGLYNSHLTQVGIPIPVVGNVELTLDQEGAAGSQCKLDGEFQDCSTVFALKDGVITGIADGIQSGDATIGGFPYFCSMSGTLDCNKKTLVGGWITCTYCIGPLADGGGACALLNGVGGTTGVGGHFAGPLTASYDVNQFAFVNGAWTGAESLCAGSGVCNDGAAPEPDGAPISSVISDSGLYLGPNDFGGSGHWNAKYTADQ